MNRERDATPTLADLVREARLARHWSQRMMGVQVGVTQQYIAEVEAGRRGLAPQRIKAWTAVLQVDAEPWLAAVRARVLERAGFDAPEVMET